MKTVLIYPIGKTFDISASAIHIQREFNSLFLLNKLAVMIYLWLPQIIL